jgi:hypothetical protein
MGSKSKRENMRVAISRELIKRRGSRERGEESENLILSKIKQRCPQPSSPSHPLSCSPTQPHVSSQTARSLCIFHLAHREVTQSNKYQKERALHK